MLQQDQLFWPSVELMSDYIYVNALAILTLPNESQ